MCIGSDHLSIARESSDEIVSSLQSLSIATSTRFATDNEVIASGTYQTALANLHQLESRQAEFDADTSMALAVPGTVVATSTYADSERTERLNTGTITPAREHILSSGRLKFAMSDHFYH